VDIGQSIIKVAADLEISVDELKAKILINFNDFFSLSAHDSTGRESGKVLQQLYSPMNNRIKGGSVLLVPS